MTTGATWWAGAVLAGLEAALLLLLLLLWKHRPDRDPDPDLTDDSPLPPQFEPEILATLRKKVTV